MLDFLLVQNVLSALPWVLFKSVFVALFQTYLFCFACIVLKFLYDCWRGDYQLSELRVWWRVNFPKRHQEVDYTDFIKQLKSRNA